MSEAKLRNSAYWFWAGLIITAFKLWLTRAQPVYAIGGAAHDDRLFLLLAESLIKGEWLGAYNQMTLAKGPFYSIWIAGLYWFGIPLGLGVQLAYAGACALLTRACRPAIRSAGLLFAIYAFLLWNPMSFEGPTLGRIIRQQIYTPLALVILAGLVALYGRRAEKLSRQLPWAILVGLASGCFWLTREESVWLVPSVGLLAVAAIVGAYRISRLQVGTMTRSFGVAIACAALPIFLVAWQNHRHYGWFGTVEFRAPEFNDAYGAMVRVKMGPEIPYVPVTRQAREAMYAISPSFAKLQPFLEGDYGRDWAGAGTPMTKQPAAERQIGGGWMTWALRDTVAAAGFCHDAKEAMIFYQKMADDINRACDAGRLPAYPRRSGFLPRWQAGQTAEVLRTSGIFFNFVVSYQSFNAHTLPSIGDDNDLRLFRDLSRDRVSPGADATNLILPNQFALDTWKLNLLQKIGLAFGRIIQGLFFIAGALFLVRLTPFARNRELTFPLMLAIATLGGSFAYCLINAIVHVTSFPVIAVSTFWPIYPLLQIFSVAVFWDIAAIWLIRSAAVEKLA